MGQGGDDGVLALPPMWSRAPHSLSNLHPSWAAGPRVLLVCALLLLRCLSRHSRALLCSALPIARSLPPAAPALGRCALPAMSSADKVRASHLLVKHQGSRRPASWKDPDGRVIRTTTRDEAVAKLQQFKTDIDSGKATLADLAVQNSDCSSAKRGGDLGWFGRGQMQEPFEKATFGLKVGELSDIIDTDSGSHIILRTG